MQPCSTVYIQNQNITTNTSIVGCEVQISNTDISNGASIRVHTTSETIVTNDFEVELGSVLEIE